MRMILVALSFLACAEACAREWKPRPGEADRIVSRGIEEMLRATRHARADDSCLTIELRSRFSNPRLTRDWCKTDPRGNAYVETR